MVATGARCAQLVSGHEPTCRQVIYSLGAAGLSVRAARRPSELSRGEPDVAALLVDLDVAPDEPVARLIEEARRHVPQAPLLAIAGVCARTRLIDALCETDVNHVLPKRGAHTLPRGGVTVSAGLGGPDGQDLFAAVKRLLAGPEAPGVAPYLLAGAPVHDRVVHTSQDKDAALAEVVGFVETLHARAEVVRRVELVTEELLMNALYDAPRDASGAPRNTGVDRRLSVALGSDEAVRLRYGSDGQTLAVAVKDPFGSLTKHAVTERLRMVFRGVLRITPGVAGSGLGLVMAYAAANQLIFSVEPGTVTEVTAVLHIAGTNRETQERGTAVHFYGGAAR